MISMASFTASWTDYFVGYVISRRGGHQKHGRIWRESQQEGGIFMKRTWLWCLLGVLSLGSASMAQAQQASGEIEKAILALEGQWMQSQRTNNPDLVAPLLAEKFVNTSTEGKVRNRAETLAIAKATKFQSVD
jgi:hypothetical protein